jgi:ABC-type sugar transport system permease subunit
MTTLIRESKKPADAPKSRTKAQLWQEMKQHRWHYAFLVPMAVLALAFTIWPIVASWGISFYDWDGFGPLDRFIAVNPLWGFVDQPVTAVSAKLAAWSGASLVMSRAFYRDMWRAGRLRVSHLQDAVEHRGGA